MISESAVLVGNGPSAVAEDNGAKIDSAELVVRFNLYPIELMSELGHKIGTKTDVWCLNTGFSTVKTAIEHRKKIGNEDFGSFLVGGKMPGRVMRYLAEQYPSKRVAGADTMLVRSLFGFLNKKPSTGLIACAYYLRYYPTIYITGFDILQGEDCPNEHYWEKQNRSLIQDKHSPVKEAAWLRHHIESGRVVVL